MELKTKVKDYFPTGSRYICNPPVLDTDEDWVVLVDEIPIAIMDLVADGWKRPEDKNDYGEGGYSYFTTFRKDYFNLIVMENRAKFELWRKATEEAKKQNLLDKDDRVALFESILLPKPSHNTSLTKWYTYSTATGVNIADIIGNTTIVYDDVYQNP